MKRVDIASIIRGMKAEHREKFERYDQAGSGQLFEIATRELNVLPAKPNLEKDIAGKAKARISQMHFDRDWASPTFTRVCLTDFFGQ